MWDKKSFTDPASEQFVLVSLDFPRGEEAKARVPDPERNAQLMAKYGIEGFPTVLVLTPDGDVLGRTGYQQGSSPRQYLGHVRQLRVQGRRSLSQVVTLIQDYERAEGEARDEVLGRILDAFPESQFQSRLAGVVKGALGSESSATRERAVRALSNGGWVDGEVVAAARELDPKNEQGLYVSVLAKLIDGVDSPDRIEPAVKAVDEFLEAGIELDDEAALVLYINVTWWCHNYLEDEVKSKRYARLALPLTEDPEYVDFLKKVLGD